MNRQNCQIYQNPVMTTVLSELSPPFRGTVIVNRHWLTGFILLNMLGDKSIFQQCLTIAPCF
jgi:hypothetical protein